MFHWKTCSIHGTSPRIVNINGIQQCEGIFDATNEEPKPRYCIKRCEQSNCLCCNSSYPRRQPIQTSAIRFNTYRIHTFVNGYDAVLNCSVVSIIAIILFVCFFL